MLEVDNISKHVLLLGFSVTSFVFFGFIAWKPKIWASLTPIKPCSVVRLATIYRWIAIIALVGVLIDILIVKK